MPDKASGWLAGFWAASLLFHGRHDDYAAARDTFLRQKSKERDTPELSKQLREVAEIAETHFVMTFGTKRIDALRMAADIIEFKPKE